MFRSQRWKYIVGLEARYENLLQVQELEMEIYCRFRSQRCKYIQCRYRSQKQKYIEDLEARNGNILQVQKLEMEIYYRFTILMVQEKNTKIYIVSLDKTYCYWKKRYCKHILQFQDLKIKHIVGLGNKDKNIFQFQDLQIKTYCRSWN